MDHGISATSRDPIRSITEISVFISFSYLAVFAVHKLPLKSTLGAQRYNRSVGGGNVGKWCLGKCNAFHVPVLIVFFFRAILSFSQILHSLHVNVNTERWQLCKSSTSGRNSLEIINQLIISVPAVTSTNLTGTEMNPSFKKLNLSSCLSLLLQATEHHVALQRNSDLCYSMYTALKKVTKMYLLLKGITTLLNTHLHVWSH